MFKSPLRPVLCTALALSFCLSGCGGPEESALSPQPEHSLPVLAQPSPSLTPEPTPTPYDGPENPLTGMPIDSDALNRRPVAIMLNNQIGRAHV